MIGLLFVLVTCWIGKSCAVWQLLSQVNIPRCCCVYLWCKYFLGGVAGAVDGDKDEFESLGVSEGENLTIPIHIKKSDEDPQVLVTRLKGSSQEPIVQLTCHDGDCVCEGWESGVSLIYDGGNMTLILMNVSYNQTGLYKVRKLSVTPLETQSYNVTVYRK